MSAIQLAEFGADLFFELGAGNWLFLGGPSLWYATNLFITPVAAGLVVYGTGSTCRISVSRDAGAVNIGETRLGITRETRVPAGEITGASIDNVGPGAKWLWAIPLGLSSWYLGVDGVAYLVNPHGFGRGPVTGAFFLAQVAANLAALAVLLLWQQHRLVIRTSKMAYILAFSPAWNASRVFDDVARVIDARRVDPRAGRRYPARLVAGACFIALAVASRAWWLCWGDPVRVVLFTGGLALLFQGITRETGSRVHRVASTGAGWDAGKTNRGFDTTFVTFLAFTLGSTVSSLFLLCPGNPVMLGVFLVEFGIGTGILVLLVMGFTGIPRATRRCWILGAVLVGVIVAGAIVAWV